jgi:hypothetical protein
MPEHVIRKLTTRSGKVREIKMTTLALAGDPDDEPTPPAPAAVTVSKVAKDAANPPSA